MVKRQLKGRTYNRDIRDVEVTDCVRARLAAGMEPKISRHLKHAVKICREVRCQEMGGGWALTIILRE